MAILEVRGLKKSFGGIMAVAGVDLQVEEGRTYGIIGPNGAGKTTLFHLISGYYPSDAGRVLFKGRDVTGFSPQHLVRMGMGRSFQVTKIFPRMSVLENVQTALLFRKGEGLMLLADAANRYRTETEEILSMTGLLEKADEMAGVLAAGDRKRLELGIVLATEPDLLLLDEPTCGMSPVETSATIELIREISRRKSLTVLFTEHKMDMVFCIASHITVMNFGQVISAGEPDLIRKDKRVQQVYFGDDTCCSK